MYGHDSIRVFPFGYPRVYACLQLVVAFRSLPRPSSALSAKASTVCPYSLDLLYLTVSLQPDLFSLQILRMYLQSFLTNSFVSSLAKKLSFAICSVEIVLPFTEKLFHYTLCSFQRTLPFRVGGDKQNRTADPLLARQVLSQLSYTPI